MPELTVSNVILLGSLVLGILYFTLSIIYSIGFSRVKRNKSTKKRTVSVIIASRNEEKTLPQLLTILANQTYSSEMYEVIIANDCSTDKSEAILQEYSKKFKVINYINVKNREKVVSPKKNALSQAIAISKGEIILLTDADCYPKATWIESMVRAFDDDVSMVAGYSKTDIKWKEAKLVQQFEHIDLLCLYIGLAGGLLINQQFACIGQNLAYTREAYDKVGGFEQIKHIVSGDDCNFLQLLRREKMKITFNFDSESFVKTKPITSWNKLINQHSRWFSNLKLMLKLNIEFFFILLGIFLYYSGIILSLFIDWRYFLMLLALKIFGESQMFYFAYPKFQHNRHLIWFYPIWSFIQIGFNVVTIFIGQFNMFNWHGRRK